MYKICNEEGEGYIDGMTDADKGGLILMALAMADPWVLSMRELQYTNIWVLSMRELHYTLHQ